MENNSAQMQWNLPSEDAMLLMRDYDLLRYAAKVEKKADTEDDFDKWRYNDLDLDRQVQELLVMTAASQSQPEINTAKAIAGKLTAACKKQVR